MSKPFSPTESFKVVDLFAGPGGLAEGFSAFRSQGRPTFDVQLSIEKEQSAFATLRLRAFFRQFAGAAPEEYYDYVAGTAKFSDLTKLFPNEWEAACAETLMLELGTAGTEQIIDPIIDEIRENAGGNAILLGGPPCQAYSLVGRARNSGIVDYKADEDHRHFLYREYIRIIERLKPAVFVMENVKGFLSSRVDGQRIFTQVLRDLGSAGGGYEIRPIVEGQSRGGHEFVIRSESYGIPQRRHRVILLGVRRDLVHSTVSDWPRLRPCADAPTVADVLMHMPKLRSGLSKSEDNPVAWKGAVIRAFSEAAEAAYRDEDDSLDKVAARLVQLRIELDRAHSVGPRSSQQSAPVTDAALSRWLVDPKLKTLANHHARGHMESDLARYAYAAVFSEIMDSSPKASDFPSGLAPAHQNWLSGKFNDRFRVQGWKVPSTTITSHISKDGHYFIHPDPLQCRSLTVREAARLQTFPDNYFFEGNRTEQYVQVGNAVPPLLAYQIASVVFETLTSRKA